ncbi:TspO/MBR family protein [Methanofollis fontis]|uniref:TspO protein n=1 Tax=Methanofollis fontis TaxID=2052832 RepID=A0A483CYX6_9EURY|nr:TspO/MBR family protein [Methanofollis fontis]TAJ45016.1 TspO protein [Methanofollis fontis]
MNATTLRHAAMLVAAIIITNLAGIIGSLFTAPNIPVWYAGLEKSSLNPPSWVFAPVWTILFILMGISLYLFWREGLERPAVRIAIVAFAVQLVLNTLWSILFFGLRSPFLALIEIVILWVAIAATIWLGYRVSRPAAYLLVPYILWVSFAAYLNWTIWVLNP